MSLLQLRVRAPLPGELWELRFLIDGVDLVGDRGAGLDPDDLLPDRLVPGGSPRREVLIRRGCGDVGCGSASAVIRRDGGMVVWEAWESDLGEVAFPECRFDAALYGAEIRRVHEDRSWEPTARTVARRARELISPELTGRLAEIGLRDLAVYGTERGSVEVWFGAGVRDEGHWQVFVDVTGLEPGQVVDLLDTVPPDRWIRVTWLPNDATASQQEPPMAGPGWRRSSFG